MLFEGSVFFPLCIFLLFCMGPISKRSMTNSFLFDSVMFAQTFRFARNDLSPQISLGYTYSSQDSA